MKIRDTNPSRFYQARQESILDLSDDPEMTISNLAIPNPYKPEPNKLKNMFFKKLDVPYNRCKSAIVKAFRTP